MSHDDLNRKVSEFVSPVQAAVRLDQTVEEALLAIRALNMGDKIFYFYVVDTDMRLRGVVSTRSLILNAPNKKIHEIMEHQVITISTNHTLHDAMEMLTQHRLLALPVIDGEKKFQGIIDIQLYLNRNPEPVDALKNRRNKADIFQLMGLSLEDEKKQSIWKSYLTRMPWIFCNLIGGTACAIISRVFELVLLEVILLAMFIPLVLTLSESISMQSMTASLQVVSRPKVNPRIIFYRIFREWKMVLMMAITCGLIVGGISILWGEGMKPALAIASGILISVTLSGTIGASMPILLHISKLDPKVAAGPVVLMIADVMTTAIYLGLATWWLL